MTYYKDEQDLMNENIEALAGSNKKKYYWRYRDMFKSSANSDIFVRFIPDSWMLLLDSSVYGGTFAAGRAALVAHRETTSYMTFFNKISLTSGAPLFFPRIAVTENVNISTTANAIGTSHSPYLIVNPDYLLVNISNTVTDEEITTLLRAYLPDTTTPTVTISLGVAGADNTNDYNTVTEII